MIHILTVLSNPPLITPTDYATSWCNKYGISWGQLEFLQRHCRYKGFYEQRQEKQVSRYVVGESELYLKVQIAEAYME